MPKGRIEWYAEWLINTFFIFKGIFYTFAEAKIHGKIPVKNCKILSLKNVRMGDLNAGGSMSVILKNCESRKKSQMKLFGHENVFKES